MKQPHGGEIRLLEKGETANPNGRPRLVFSTIAAYWKRQGYERATATRVKDTYEYLLSLPLKTVLEIAGNSKDSVAEQTNEYPALLRLVAKEMVGRRGLDMLKEMLDRAHGKPKQTTDVTSGGEKVGTFTGWEFFKQLAGDQNDGDGDEQEGRPEDEG